MRAQNMAAWIAHASRRVAEACNEQRTSALNRSEEVMEKDVVCGMQVDPAKAAGQSPYQGKTYYFCSNGCKAKFDAKPAQFAK